MEREKWRKNCSNYGVTHNNIFFNIFHVPTASAGLFLSLFSLFEPFWPFLQKSGNRRTTSLGLVLLKEFLNCKPVPPLRARGSWTSGPGGWWTTREPPGRGGGRRRSKWRSQVEAGMEQRILDTSGQYYKLFMAVIMPLVAYFYMILTELRG